MTSYIVLRNDINEKHGTALNTEDDSVPAIDPGLKIVLGRLNRFRGVPQGTNPARRVGGRPAGFSCIPQETVVRRRRLRWSGPFSGPKGRDD
jgi:hypothetical protein